MHKIELKIIQKIIDEKINELKENMIHCASIYIEKESKEEKYTYEKFKYACRVLNETLENIESY